MRKSSFYGFLLVFFLGLILTGSSRIRAQQLPADPSRRPLIDVLIELNKVRGVYFLFSQQSLARTPVNGPVMTPGISIERILTQVLKNTGLRYKKVDDRTFVILDRRPAASTSDSTATPDYPDPATVSAAPPRMQFVTGHVIAHDGQHLQGVSVTIQHTQKGTITDLSGAFSLEAAREDTLVFSFVGYQTKKMAAGSVGADGILLDASEEPLTAVLVTALGIQKQERSLGYATDELDGGLFTGARAVNLGNALAGQVAGVSVAENATGPYGSSRVLIRGNASLSGNNQPLFVVDGIPYDNTTQSSAGQYGGQDLGDGLSNLNPDNIESVLVLKGVAASALYGYRGGNGAILIRTKSGSRTHGIGVQVNNNLTVNTVMDEREYQYVYGQGLSGIKPTTGQMALAAPYYSWGARMDGTSAVNYLSDNYAYSPAKNNFADFFRTGVMNQPSVGLTGANAKGHFRLGISDLHLADVVPNSSMKQQGFNLNSTYYVTNRLQMDLTADYVFENVTNRVSLSDDAGNVIAAPMYLANSFDIRWMKTHTAHPDGTEWLPGTTDLYFENPYYIAYDYQDMTSRNRLTGGLTLKYHLLDWLYVQGQVTRDGYLLDVTNIVPSGVEYTRSDGVHGGNLTQYEVDYHELNTSFMVGAHKKLASELNFNADFGANRQDNSSTISGIGAVPFSNNRAAGPFLVAGNYNAADIINPPYSSHLRRYRVNSIYGSADLSFRNYLFLNVTARNDWFSTLNINTDDFLYPSVSGSFLFSEVWRLPGWVSLGKLRASYAASSNGTEPYQNALVYGIQSYSLPGQPLGYIATGGLIPNPNLRPVSIAEREIGLSTQFFHNRLGLDLTWYSKQTTDDIVRTTVSTTSGYSQYIENIGRIRNTGIEGLLTATPVKTTNFSWSLSFNYAINHNKVLYIGGLPSIVINGAYPRWGSEVSISNVVGLPYGQIMGYAYRHDAKGNIIYSDGVSNPAPAGEPEPTGVVPLGSTVYKQTGGITNELHYRWLTLSALVDFKFGAKIYSGTNLLLYYYGLQKATLAGRDGGYVGKGVLENGHPNTFVVPAQQYFQDISAGGTDHIAQEFVYDASFIKLRSATLTYTVPATALKKRFIKGLNFSLVGRNLAILMKHVPNVDPESSINNTNGQGLELTGYPATRSWGFNMNIKF
ncbi:SusC/RagA family TonB-linked outer membrane protein [Puia dinghuensis]|uniref:SusC/RagA family TonB-linked outer membrane protein n=1 Tax=Puia dinghuensis TaxID=1792502 RepID=A0A8J2U9V5_9BACT|nr:SusC/RagA family TonB-linked outer membrane protein [Puia dinghuensis]GGA88389.1 SusC/RagA family TonB-linked outer membrane protein [Puia dinghuensis]